MIDAIEPPLAPGACCDTAPCTCQTRATPLPQDRLAEILIGARRAHNAYQNHHNPAFACCSAHPAADAVPDLLAVAGDLLATIADEMAYLNRCLAAVDAVCTAAEKQATRWEQPLPVPEWVAVVRQAAGGEHPVEDEVAALKVLLAERDAQIAGLLADAPTDNYDELAVPR